MKRFGIVLLAVISTLLCLCLTACGPSFDFTGTFVRETDSRTYTLTLRNDGTFKFERKFKKSNGLSGDPVDNPTSNTRTGKYVIYFDKSQATFEYSYYDAASGQTFRRSAMGTLSKKDGKVVLSITGDEINGSFTKK